MTTAFVPKESTPGETRVAATPESVRRLIKAGLSVVIEAGAGAASFYADADYVEAGASIADDGAAARAAADLVLQVGIPTPAEVAGMREGASLVSFVWAFDRHDLVRAMAERDLTVFAMDAIPRITRAQKDDARSSQANLAGYKAVILAASHLPKIFPMLMTAAGTIRPVKCVVIGAGVAGLQAIATARRLGAVVEVSDVRPEVKEQAHSLGATYIEVRSDENLSGAGGYAREQSDDFKKRQQQVLHEHLVAADVIICTALIPYRDAPVIVSEDAVKEMRDGSVIVDLAAERGGNCACTESGKTVVKHGVTVVGELGLEATVPINASAMYANNIRNIVLDQVKDGAFAWKLDDEIVAGSLVTHGGEVMGERLRTAMGLPVASESDEELADTEVSDEGASAAQGGDASAQAPGADVAGETLAPEDAPPVPPPPAPPPPKPSASEEADAKPEEASE